MSPRPRASSTDAARPAAPRVRTITRASEIAQVAAKHGFGYLFETGPLSRRLVRGEEDESHLSNRAQRLRDMLTELGPTFVKFGQLLSLRADLVPPDIVLGLRELQEHVAPFPYEQAARVVEAELGLGIERLFLEFEETPIAAASIGQVHRARLPNGREVAVKVQRPDAPRQIEADIRLMEQVARLVRDRVRLISFIDPVALVEEFARTIREELDYGREARNAEQFAENFAREPRVVVPAVWRDYSTDRVLTLEFLHGTTLADLDYESLSLARRRELAYHVAETWLTMIFEHGFFHGDPHPANIMVVGGRLGIVDLGMAGALRPDDLEHLTLLFIDAVRRNIPALPERLRALGVEFPRELDGEFVRELEVVFDRYYGMRVSDIDPIQLIREAFALIFRMHLRLPTRFVLVDRAIATLGSVGVELYPDFNVFEVARPYARELMLERFRPERLAQRMRTEAERYLRVVRELPFQVHDTLDELRDGQVEVGFRHRGLEQLTRDADRLINRVVVAVVAGAGIIGSAILASVGEKGWHTGLAIGGFVLSFMLGAWVAWGVIRSGRL
jgi:ubiquinone biosynthesis protein